MKDRVVDKVLPRRATPVFDAATESCRADTQVGGVGRSQAEEEYEKAKSFGERVWHRGERVMDRAGDKVHTA